MGAVYYNIMLDAENLQFIEECINKHDMAPVYYDPFHLQIVRNYMQLLGVSRCDTLTLTDAKRIKKVLEKQKKGNRNLHIYYVKDPVNAVIDAVNETCNILGVYKKRRKEQIIDELTTEFINGIMQNELESEIMGLQKQGNSTMRECARMYIRKKLQDLQ